VKQSVHAVPGASFHGRLLSVLVPDSHLLIPAAVMAIFCPVC
jgi:hypothetical protein